MLHIHEYVRTYYLYDILVDPMGYGTWRFYYWNTQSVAGCWQSYLTYVCRLSWS